MPARPPELFHQHVSWRKYTTKYLKLQLLYAILNLVRISIIEFRTIILICDTKPDRRSNHESSALSDRRNTRRRYEDGRFFRARGARAESRRRAEGDCECVYALGRPAAARRREVRVRVARRRI